MKSLPTDKRSLLTEKFHALLDGSDLVASNAAHGHALDDLETFQWGECKKNDHREHQAENSNFCSRRDYRVGGKNYTATR